MHIVNTVHNVQVFKDKDIVKDYAECAYSSAIYRDYSAVNTPRVYYIY